MVFRRGLLAGLHLGDPTKVSLLQAETEGHTWTARACIPSLASDDMSHLFSPLVARKAAQELPLVVLQPLTDQLMQISSDGVSVGPAYRALAPEIRPARELRARIRAGRRRSVPWLFHPSATFLRAAPTRAEVCDLGKAAGMGSRPRRFSTGGGMILTVECVWQSHGVMTYNVLDEG